MRENAVTDVTKSGYLAPKAEHISYTIFKELCISTDFGQARFRDGFKFRDQTVNSIHKS